MIKIDLHLHSPASRQNGDAIAWMSLYDSIKRLKDNNVSIAAFSDHNILDVQFYKESFALAKTANILLLPAIEVNVVRTDGQIANIIYIFEENLSDEEMEKISKIAATQIPKRGISLKMCETIFKEFNTIKIPHVGKSDHFKYDDLCQISFDAIEISNENNKNFCSVMKKNLKTSIVAFSDTHKWNDYPQANRLITIIGEHINISFHDLKNVLKLNRNFTKRRIDD